MRTARALLPVHEILLPLPSGRRYPHLRRRFDVLPTLPGSVRSGIDLLDDLTLLTGFGDFPEAQRQVLERPGEFLQDSRPQIPVAPSDEPMLPDRTRSPA